MAATRRLSQLVSASLPLDLPAGPLAVALSGGADSACLAFLCCESGSPLAAAVHVDHQLPASPMMAHTAARIAEVLDIEMETIRVEVPDGPSLEEQARDVRYAALEKVEASVITGHTRDDNAETMIINLIRGTGSAGLGGIPHHRSPNIYRPMLHVSRSETREIASLAGLPFVDDPMNEDLSLTRNRVRLEIIPRMREINPKVDGALARAAGFVRRDSDLLDEMAGTPTGSTLAASVVVTLPTPIAERMVHRFLEANGVGATADRIARVWSVAIGESDRQDLTGGRSVVRQGAMLVLE